MKYSAVIITLFCGATLAQTWVDNNDSRWIWGYVDDKIDNTNLNDTKTDDVRRSPVNYDPCNPYFPTKPSFKRPGRRVSEEKCEEYKWDKIEREERTKRYKECAINQGITDGLGVVGGRPTYLGEFPHMGALGWKAAFNDSYVFKCGSTLISSKFVLTAAHCSKGSPRDTAIADVLPKIVRLNDKNLYHTDDQGASFSEDVEIFKIIVHPNYKSPKKYFDIALIEIRQEVFFTELMQPACLWTKHEERELGPEVTLTGWGVLRSGSLDISPELQAADVNIIDSKLCDQLLHPWRNRNWWGVQEHQLCAGKLAGGVDACQGDSGGPLQVKEHVPGSVNESVYYVIGVTSLGIGCALPNMPGIYTRVSIFLDWIEEHVWP